MNLYNPLNKENGLDYFLTLNHAIFVDVNHIYKIDVAGPSNHWNQIVEGGLRLFQDQQTHYKGKNEGDVVHQSSTLFGMSHQEWIQQTVSSKNDNSHRGHTPATMSRVGQIVGITEEAKQHYPNNGDDKTGRN